MALGDATATSKANAFSQASGLFRFVQVRAPQLAQRGKTKRIPYIRTCFSDDPSAFHAQLRAPPDASSVAHCVRFRS